MKIQNDLENEVWVKHPIGIMVSNMGRVETRYKGKNYGYGRGNGYLAVKWKGKQYYIHVLVAEIFIHNPYNLPTVDHIDRDPSNNRADNLRWADMKMQCDNREIDFKAIAEKKSIPILQLNKNMEIVKEWSSANQAERECGFHHGNINKCLKGRKQSAYGFIWEYKQKSEAV